MIYILLAVVVFLCWFTWYLIRDNRKIFMQSVRRDPEILTDVVSRNEGFCIEHFEIHSPRGFKLNGYLKIPVLHDKQLPVVLLLGGLFTGKDIIELVEDTPEIEPLIIATMDYPYEGKKRLKWWQLLPAIPKIRRAALNSVHGLLLMIDMLTTRQDVDENRIYLSGVSFGSFFGIAAAACDSRIRSVASLYGGGQLQRLFATNLPFHIPLINQLIGIAAKLIVYPLEPLHYVRYISPRPLLVVGGSEDERFPKACAYALYDRANQPKDLVWFQSTHPHPKRADLINEMTNVVVKWMTQRGLLREKPVN